MPHRLSHLLLDRVDLVPDGSNPDAHIVLFKSKKRGHMPAKKKITVKRAAKADSRSKSKQRGDEDEEEEEDELVAKGEDDEDDEELAEDDEDEADDEEEAEDEEEPARRKKSKKTPAKKKAVKKGGKKAAAAAEDEDEAVEEDDDEGVEEDADDDAEEIKKIAKGMSDEAREAFLKMRTELKDIRKETREARKMAQVEKAKREKLEYIEKAKKTIPYLTGTAEEKAALLQALYGDEPIDKKTADAIVKLLKTGDTAVRSLMMETGSRNATNTTDDSPVSELREKQAEIMKAEPKLTKEQAFQKACEQNPGVFQKYRLEKSRNGRRREIDLDED